MWLLACTSPPPSVEDPVPTETAEQREWPEASWTAEEVASLLASLLSPGIPEPLSLRSSFEGLFQGRDNQCPPGVGYSMTGSAGCTSQSGWFYAGDSSLLEDGGGGFTLACNCYVIDPDGNWFMGGGQLEYIQSQGQVIARMDGSWGYEGQAGWLGQSSSFNYSVSIEQERIHLQGGLGVPGGVLYFEDLGMAPDCGPFGLLKLRDPSGWWYSLDFGRECTGCGELSWGEQDLGPLCLDLEVLNGLGQRLSP